jgi:hypothetical protein
MSQENRVIGRACRSPGTCVCLEKGTPSKLPVIVGEIPCTKAFLGEGVNKVRIPVASVIAELIVIVHIIVLVFSESFNENAITGIRPNGVEE